MGKPPVYFGYPVPKKRTREELEARLAELRAEHRATERAREEKRIGFGYLVLPPNLTHLPGASAVANDREPPSNVVTVSFGHNALRAYEAYRRASDLDEDNEHLAEAETLYREAIRLDPTLAIAYTNLGNIRFRRGDDRAAEQWYRRAIAIDAGQPEAHYNLGYVLLERGDIRAALPSLQETIRLSPTFADAHFNLAAAHEHLGQAGSARDHWLRYLELEPNGPWAEHARDHLTPKTRRGRR